MILKALEDFLCRHHFDGGIVMGLLTKDPFGFLRMRSGFGRFCSPCCFFPWGTFWTLGGGRLTRSFHCAHAQNATLPGKSTAT